MSAGQRSGGEERWMARALELAVRGWGRVSPNPLVGAVVVDGNEVVGEGWHAEYGGAHAEVAALSRAGARARGATLFVTLEPCAHFGKTPPCTDAILAAGVSKVVFASADPNPAAQGGADVLRAAGVAVAGPVLESAARSLNAAFFHLHSATGPPRPWIELKLALSLDSRVADLDGRSAWLTSEAARSEVHRLRAGHDAIAVGIGTVVADNPQLTVRGPIVPRLPPTRVVFDRQLRLPLASRLVASASDVPLWVVGSPDAPARRRAELEKRGAIVLVAPHLPKALAQLREAGIRSLFCEGGAAVASALLRGDLVDRLTLVYAPLLLGPRGFDPFREIRSLPLAETRRWSHLRTERFGPDSLICVER